MAPRDLPLTYKADDFTTTLPAREYIQKFNDAGRFLNYCKECGNYGKLWACPPLQHDSVEELRQYSIVTLTATKIVPDCNGLPLSTATEFLRPERLRIEKRLRDMEKKSGGRALAFAGSCLYCPEGTCSRLDNLPCRHPDLVRPSLEAYGFDLGKTATELFGFPLLWSRDGFIPEYLTLICGLFYNQTDTRPR